MKKLIVILSLFLVACSSSNDNSNVGQAIQGNFETSNFTIYVPESWEILDQSTFTSNVPQEIMAAFRSNERSDIFTTVVNVAETPLPADINTVEFARSSLQKIKSGLTGYQEISRTEGDKTTIRFKGKRNASDSMLEHIVIYQVKDGLGYSVTASFLELEDESIVNTAIEMLESFSLK